MKCKSIISVALALLSLCASLPAAAVGKSWEPVKTERSDARVVAREGDVEIRIAPVTIMVSCSRPTTVKVYTILGQLISSETVGPGTVQLRIASRGVYIVKAAGITCKVAL